MSLDCDRMAPSGGTYNGVAPLNELIPELAIQDVPKSQIFTLKPVILLKKLKKFKFYLSLSYLNFNIML